MNYECLCKIFRWLFARLPRALIERIARLWRSLMNWLAMVVMVANVLSCRTQQQTITSESSYHQQESLARYDSTRYADLTVVHDTVAVLRTETLWREPDSVGNIYPLMTINEERSAGRQTTKNIASVRVDTMGVVNHRDGSLIDKVNQRTVPAIDEVNQRTVPAIDSRASPIRTWGRGFAAAIIFIILTIAVVIAVKLLRRFSFP